VGVSERAEQITERAGALAREGSDLRSAAATLVDLAEGDEDALREAQRCWAEALHEQPEDGDALGALVLVGAALHLQTHPDAQGS
jgi:hypothetical protein